MTFPSLGMGGWRRQSLREHFLCFVPSTEAKHEQTIALLSIDEMLLVSSFCSARSLHKKSKAESTPGQQKIHSKGRAFGEQETSCAEQDISLFK